ncbi:MAG TPA: hypothetical protein PLS70_23410 [Acidobacteriota bacterium]|nr:hypothetical protein [Acidobacteriota bacterium]
MKTKVVMYVAGFVLTVSFFSSQTFGQSRGTIAQTPPAQPVDVYLSTAQTLVIGSDTLLFTPQTLVAELMKNAEFKKFDLAIVEQFKEADLELNVSRKAFTTKYVFEVIDRRTGKVLASESLKSLGGTVEGKIANRLIHILKPHRVGTSLNSNRPTLKRPAKEGEI